MQSAAFDPVKSAEMFFTTTQAVKNASPDPNPGGEGR